MLSETCVESVRIVVVHARRLDADVAQVFARLLAKVVGRGRAPFVLDLSQVDFLDSVALRVLVKVHADLRSSGGLRVAGATSQVMAVVRLTGMTREFQLDDDVGEAVARVRWAAKASASTSRTARSA